MSNNVTSILEIIKTTYPLRTAKPKLCYINWCFPNSVPIQSKECLLGILEEVNQQIKSKTQGRRKTMFSY